MSFRQEFWFFIRIKSNFDYTTFSRQFQFTPCLSHLQQLDCWIWIFPSAYPEAAGACFFCRLFNAKFSRQLIRAYNIFHRLQRAPPTSSSIPRSRRSLITQRTEEKKEEKQKRTISTSRKALFAFALNCCLHSLILAGLAAVHCFFFSPDQAYRVIQRFSEYICSETEKSRIYKKISNWRLTGNVCIAEMSNFRFWMKLNFLFASIVMRGRIRKECSIVVKLIST